MSSCHLALGSNLGDRQAHIERALDQLACLPQTQLGAVSRLIDSAAVGGPAGQGPFLNAAAELHTGLDPQSFLRQLQGIQQRLGRQPAERWGARVIDLDILLWGSERIDSPQLTIPHPQMHYRRFVLEPLVEIAPKLRHPDGWSIVGRWEQLCRLPHYLAITGPIGVGKSTLSRILAAQLGADLVEEKFDTVALGRIYSGDRSGASALQEQFIQKRIRLLDAGQWATTLATKWVISDFWFGQSVAYAHVLLGPAECREHQASVRNGAPEVLEPTLVIWLDASPEKIEARIARRGRGFEVGVDRQFLARLREGFARALNETPAPAVYRPTAGALDELTDELLVVASAMAGEKHERKTNCQPIDR